MQAAETPRRLLGRSIAALVLAVLAVLSTLAFATPASAQEAESSSQVEGGQAEPVTPIAPVDPERITVPDDTIVRSPDGVPDVDVSFQEGENDDMSRTVGLVLLLGLGAIAPAILLLMTTFTRFIIVLGLTKNALALQTVPPSQVLIGLALFLTAFVMGPVIEQINEDAVQPFMNEEISQGEAISAAWEPLEEFMLIQTRDEDLQLFIDLSTSPPPATIADVAPTTLIPAFVISELRTGFIIGFIVFIPFLLIDLVVAAVLMSMGMVMVPPVFISLPLKLLLFVLVDGWVLMIGAMVQSVGAVGLS